jgi:mannan endo-1,6-alpha-mannosidase
MFEPACETVETCDNDQYSFKGYLSRFMWATTLMAPFTASAVTTLLRTSSMAAAQACSGGDDRVTCGEHWYYGGYDGVFGVGQQISALETLQGLLIRGSVPPLHSNQVHLMAAPTTSTAPVPTSTYSYSNASFISSDGMSFRSMTSSESESSDSTIHEPQISSLVASSSLHPSSPDLFFATSSMANSRLL